MSPAWRVWSPCWLPLLLRVPAAVLLVAAPLLLLLLQEPGHPAGISTRWQWHVREYVTPARRVLGPSLAHVNAVPEAGACCWHYKSLNPPAWAFWARHLPLQTDTNAEAEREVHSAPSVLVTLQLHTNKQDQCVLLTCPCQHAEECMPAHYTHLQAWTQLL